MSQQIQITGGAKVRNLDGVLTGTSGVLSSVPLGAANGVATLDSGGKVPVSQLPSSVVTYLGTWNAATNTPTLVNGTGDAGDMYICNVAGTVNFGAGPVVFVVGDWVLYGSGTWQKSSGQNGTVTSVAASITGSAIGLTGSPITTAGTLAFAFAGTNLEYVNGAGNLTTFPTLTGYVPYSGATANVNLGEYGLSGGFIGFDTTPTSTPTAQGTMYWSADKESVDVIMNGVTGSVMQDTFYNVKNQTGATITKGTIVRANGTVGASGRILIAPFLADGSYDSKVCLGVTAETILNGEDGKVTAFGAIRQIDTSAFANGTILYASPTTAGGFTSTEPTNPSNIVTIAIVVYSDVNNGEIFVRPTFVDNAADIAASLGYTPANDALVVHLAGTETITGAKTFTATSLTLAPTSGGGTLNLKQDAFLGATNGYTSLTSSGSDFAIIAATGVSTSKQAVFSLSSLGSTLRTYTLPDASGTLALTSDIPSLAGYVTLGTTQTITGAKTFSAYTTFTSTVDITSGLTFSNSGFTLVLQPPTLSVNRTVTLPNGTGTLALTSDISYPVTSVFGRTGAVVATSGDYTTAQVTEVTNLYYTDTRARLALSFAAGSGAYNSTTGVITIPTNNNQITNGAGYITGNQTITLSGDVSGSGTTAITTTIGALKVTNAMLAGSIDLTTKVTGLLPDGNISSAATWNAKQNAITLTTTGTSGAATFTSNTLNIPQYQGVLTNPITGTGTANTIAKFSATSTLVDSLIKDDGTNVSIGYTTNPSIYLLDVNGEARFADDFIVTGATANRKITVKTSGTAGIQLQDQRVTTGKTWTIDNGVTAGLLGFYESAAAKFSLTTAGNGTFAGSVTATSFVKTSGTSSQFLKADGSVDSTAYGTGSVTSVGLSSATSGVTIGSSPITTSGTITLAIATATTSQNGLLSSADWTTFNNKQSALTNPVTGTGTTNYLPKFTGTSTIGNSLVYDNGTSVGIGTITPFSNAKLQIKTTTNVNLGFQTGTLDATGFKLNAYNDAGSANIPLELNASILYFKIAEANKMTLDASGNLGLGVTPSAWSAGISVFEFGTKGALAGAPNDVNFIYNIYYDGNNRYRASDYANSIQLTSGAFKFYTAPSGTAGSIISLTQAMTLTASGNLLVGTTNDNGQKLQVKGNARFNYSDDFGYFGLGYVSGADYGFYNYNYGRIDLKITQSTGAATFSSTLEANSTIKVTSANTTGTNINIVNTSSGGYNWNIFSEGSDAIKGPVGSLIFRDSNNGVSRMLITSGGNVLIGTTTNATGLLQVNGTIYATGFFESSSIKGKDIIATNPLLALDIDVIKYTRKSDESKDIRYGYSAEQIHSLMPELTDKDVTAVKYLDVHTILISQLQKEIKELKAKMN